MDILKADRTSLEELYAQLTAEYEKLRGLGLKLDMSRGKPARDQLDLCEPMLTVLSHNGHLEPLMGVYHRRVAPIAEALLRERNTAVRRLFDRVTFAPFPYTGDEQLLCDCNTRQDYARACAIRSSRP